MRKPPAFQFYADDFLAGTFTMSLVERGLYITLLCLQWGKGWVSEDDIAKLSNGMEVGPIASVVAKFTVGPDGNYRNDRLEDERVKQAEFREKQQENGRLGGRPTKPKPNPSLSENETQTKAKKSSPSPSPSPIGRESIAVEFPNGFPTTEADAVTAAEFSGVPTDFARMVYNECAGRNGKDCFGQPVSRWANYLKARYTKEQGRQAERKTIKPNGHEGGALNGAQIVVHQQELERINTEMKRIRDGVDSHQSMSVEDRTKLKKLKERREIVKRMLGVEV